MSTGFVEDSGGTVLGVVLASTMWGLSSVFMKVALPGMPPFGVAFARVLLSGLVLAPAAVLRARGKPAPEIPVSGGRERTHLAVLALTTVALPFCLTAWAQQHVEASLSAVLHATVPLWTLGFAVLMLGQRPGGRQLGAVAVGLLGVAVLAGLGSHGLTGCSWGGCLAVLAASACYGFGWTYMRRNLSHRQPLYIAAVIQVGAILVLAPLAAATTDTGHVELTPVRIASLLALGVISTAGAELLNYRNVARLGPTTAALTAYLIPVVGISAGIFILDEPLTARLLIGAAIVLGSVGLAVQRHQERQPSVN
ncbi:EamA family transporter [Nocardia sp. ET3-3]|uniref:EamA family transporter n=1 Tax=Nocardia terrae TaxID=2675851 RepID=A0A7K1UUN2_9NOCA|nr:DMT family transporter [Nocardia terrae]MVU78060.1 EamA family transporter [Nocardia terrae]